MTDPAPKPLCPWCLTWIEAGDDTAKVNGINWHAACAEQHAMEQMEDATLEENEA